MLKSYGVLLKNIEVSRAPKADSIEKLLCLLFVGNEVEFLVFRTSVTRDDIC